MCIRDRLPRSEVGALARSEGVSLGDPTLGEYSRAKNTLNIVMVDMGDALGKREVEGLSRGQKAGVGNLEVNEKNNGVHGLASAGVGGNDVTIAVDRVQKEIDKIRKDSFLTAKEQDEKIAEMASHIVQHEVGHSLGGTHKGSGGKGVMRDGIDPKAAGGKFSPSSRKEIKKALKKRKKE